MRLAFSKRQRKILQILGGNQCAMCSKPHIQGFHADHKLPFSKGGKTILRNGQALCPQCNLKKGNQYVRL